MKCIAWKNNHVEIIDQTQLPLSLEFIECLDLETLGDAIKRLSIRGAPALGIAAAMGLALAAVKSQAATLPDLLNDLKAARNYIASTRPTAVNLFWALDRMMKIAEGFTGSPDTLKKILIKEAEEIAREDSEMCRRIGENGAGLVKDGWNILHHCNTGFLATGDYGTALGVIRWAWHQGKRIHVWVDETRPLLQGARLTAWELSEDKIPYTLIADNMAGFLMAQGKVNMVVLGADRITASGDVVNKIGTYSLAVLAKYHNIPFYSAAPFSTIDMSIKSPDEIIIEERKSEEMTEFMGVQSAPPDAAVYNPAFDVTPHELVTGIITERGVILPPFDVNLRKA